MKKASLALALAALLLPSASRGDDPPVVEHQQALCTVPGKAISLCAAISDDVEVKRAHIYFHREGETYFSYVDMTFTGVNYCGTIPAPREGKVEAIEYYVNAVDSAGQTTRTSTFRLPIKFEAACEFPPIEKNAAKAAAIKVFATDRHQGKKLDSAFDATGVTFVPFAR